MRRGRMAAAAAVAALLAGGVVSALMSPGGPASAAATPARPAGQEVDSSGAAQVRAATAPFHSIAAAEQRGYTLLTDTRKIACIDMAGMGAMGVHWADSALVADPRIVPTRPEAMVYAPDRDGTLRLAAVEYVVIKSAWDAHYAKPPTLFGHPFQVTAAPNRFGLPAYYSLHDWVWKHNPDGRFATWNPDVVCPAGHPTPAERPMPAEPARSGAGPL